MPFKKKLIRREISSCKYFILLDKCKYNLKVIVYSLNLFSFDSSIIHLYSTLAFYFNGHISDLVITLNFSITEILNCDKILFIDHKVFASWLHCFQGICFSSFPVVLVIQPIDYLPPFVSFWANSSPEPVWIPWSVAYTVSPQLPCLLNCPVPLSLCLTLLSLHTKYQTDGFSRLKGICVKLSVTVLKTAVLPRSSKNITSY